MKKKVLFIILFVFVVAFFHEELYCYYINTSIAADIKEVSAQEMQFFEFVVENRLSYLRRGYTSANAMDARGQREKEWNRSIHKIIRMAVNGNQKCQNMVETLLLANDSWLIKKLLIDRDPQLEMAPRLIEKLLAEGNPQLVKHFKLRPATVADYREWLAGYAEQGGKIEEFSGWPLRLSQELNRMWVAEKDFNLVSYKYIEREWFPQELSGPIVVVAPKGIKFLGQKKNLGRNIILTMDDHGIIGTHLGYAGAWQVTTYWDTGFE